MYTKLTSRLLSKFCQFWIQSVIKCHHEDNSYHMFGGSGYLYSVSCCWSYIAPPPPPPALIQLHTHTHTRTHTHASYSHTCVHTLPYNPHSAPDCYRVNENTLLAYFRASQVFIFAQQIMQMHTADWKVSSSLSFETVWQYCALRLSHSLDSSMLHRGVYAGTAHWEKK